MWLIRVLSDWHVRMLFSKLSISFEKNLLCPLIFTYLLDFRQTYCFWYLTTFNYVGWNHIVYTVLCITVCVWRGNDVICGGSVTKTQHSRRRTSGGSERDNGVIGEWHSDDVQWRVRPYWTARLWHGCGVNNRSIFEAVGGARRLPVDEIRVLSHVWHACKVLWYVMNIWWS